MLPFRSATKDSFARMHNICGFRDSACLFGECSCAHAYDGGGHRQFSLLLLYFPLFSAHVSPAFQFAFLPVPLLFSLVGMETSVVGHIYLVMIATVSYFNS